MPPGRALSTTKWLSVTAARTGAVKSLYGLRHRLQYFPLPKPLFQVRPQWAVYCSLSDAGKGPSLRLPTHSPLLPPP